MTTSNDQRLTEADTGDGALAKPEAGKIKTERDLVLAVATSSTSDQMLKFTQKDRKMRKELQK